MMGALQSYGTHYYCIIYAGVNNSPGEVIGE